MGGPPTKKDGKSSNPVISFFKGLVTGTVEAVICYPTELTKTQLQLQSKTNPEYKGMWDCAVKTVKQNGPLGLYRGAFPLIVGSSFKQAARWTAYLTASDFFKDENGKLSLPANMLCGAIAGTSEAIFAVTPMETLKTRVTDDMRKGTKKYTGSVDAIRKIFVSEGLAGLYLGVVPTILKQATNQMVRFPFQQFFVRTLTNEDPVKMKSPVYNGIAGAAAGAASVIVTMPQDTVKTRMQSENAKAMYKSTFDCAKQILQKEGPMFFFSGTGPRLVRVSLDVAITFTVMPFLNNLF